MGITAQDESIIAIDPGPTTTTSNTTTATIIAVNNNVGSGAGSGAGVGVVGSTATTTTTNELLSVLHPPHQPGSGKPAYVKRGPGRPRKDNAVGLGKAHKLGLSGGGHNKNNKIFGTLQAPSMRGGLQGRKKSDGLMISGGGSNLPVNLLGELSAINHESPPRGGGGDDAAESDTSSVASSLEKIHEDFSLLPEQWPGKVCVFCNLGERSMLGQGDLLRIEIPEGFDPAAVSQGLTVKAKAEKDVNSEKAQKPGFSSRRQKGSMKMKRLQSQSSLEGINEPVDEVCGYQDEPEYSSVFDIASGYYYVHQGCANWCDGVILKEDKVTFANLEMEIIRSLSQRCLHCGNLGAGVVCKAPACGAVFHLPCAAISGCFLDPCSKTVLCSSHLDLAVSMVKENANCTVCNSPGKISTLILCSNCGNHYHGSCMAVNVDPSIRAGWQCPACKMCQACRQPGDEIKLLSCDTCDKSYHIFCLRPALLSIPKHSWKCKLCRQCTDCGARTPGSGPSSRWHANFSVCDSCYQQRNKGLACPMCGKAYRHVAQKTMLQCHLCKKYVHGTCDPAANLETYQHKKNVQPDYEYVCKPCKSQKATGAISSAGIPLIPSSSSKRASDELGCDENSVLNNNTSSQDTMFSPLHDESMQSTENSTDIVWLDKSTLNNEDKHPPPLPVNLPQHHHQTPKDNKLLNYEAKLHKRKSSSGGLSGSGPGGGGGGRGKTGADRVAHYSTNSNNRRQKVTDLVKKRGPKPKLSRMFGSGRMHQRASTDSAPKEGEEPVGVENRMILCSARDDFVLQQDVCVMCGAYGNDLEGRLISCAQCGQCYHPFCVNVKVNRVILTKGWRCLDCTVCEGCGQRNDEGRLILCDECDVSFHIYCMDPPLDRVPDGTWKCKWCVVCQYCGSNEPGKNSIWHNNYTTCGPCASYTTCPVCKLEYTEGELIIKCSKCDRWIHASCDSIKDDDDAEKCSDENYNCVLCRPSDVLPPHLRPPPAPVVTKVDNPPKSPDLFKSSSHFVDGVTLSDNGLSHIKSLALDVPRKKRKKMPAISEMEAGILAAIESVVSGGSEEKRGDKDDDRGDYYNKRPRSKFGIGGFLVKIRGPRNKYDDDDLSIDQGFEEGKKPKRKGQRKKVKNKLVENFPVYLQEAFFGKALLEPSSKETDLVVNTNDELDDATHSIKNENVIKLSKEEIKEIEAIKAKQMTPEKVKSDNRPIPQASLQSAQQQQNNNLVAEIAKDVRKLHASLDVEDGDIGLDILDGELLDNDFMEMDNIMEADDIKVEEGLVDFRVTDDSNDISLDHISQDVNPKDEFNDILTGQFGLENIDPGLPSMDSKDVEDIFKGVLIDESQDTLFSQVSTVPPVPEGPSSRVNSNQSLPSSSITVSSPSSIMPPHIAGPVQASPGLPRTTPQPNLQSPVNFPPPSPYPSEYSNSPQFSPAFSEPPSPWPVAQAEGESEQPTTYNQKSMLKLEADEALGAGATTSSVLYANMNHPELKRDYANFLERAKQISKIWRNLTAEQRAPYLQKARENRAASRMQKAHQDHDKLSSGPSKNVRQETQEERQWKQMQALRQQQQQQQQQPGVGVGVLPGSEHKDGAVLAASPAPPGMPYAPPSPAPMGVPTQRMMPPGSPGIEHVRQPLQSPHSPSPMNRPPFPTGLQMGRPRPPNMTVAMPPPSPSGVYQQRPDGSPQGVGVGVNVQNIRGPLYARLPFGHQPPRTPMSMQNDVYGTPPATPGSADSIPQSPMSGQGRPFDSDGPSVMHDQFSHNSPLSQPSEQDGRPGSSPQTPEAKQHLRGLLQRNQIKRLEQEQLPPQQQQQQQQQQVVDNRPPPWAHPSSNEVTTPDGQQIQRLQMSSAPQKPSEFRQPLLPSHVRIPANVAQLSPGHPQQRPPTLGEFRLGAPPNMDPRQRILLQQQHRGVLVQQQQRPPQFQQFAPNPNSPQIRNSLDPYDHLVIQQQQQQRIPVSSSSMLAQQLGRPLTQPGSVPGQGPVVSVNPPQLSPHHNLHSAVEVHQQQHSPMVTSVVTTNPDQASPASASMADHQELPDSVTEELEKLEQEHNNEHGVGVGVEGEASELADLGMDDDELLGMGDDFNILEYADSELDDVVGGEKTNILDNLDLEEDDKDEDGRGRKDDEVKDGDKKDNTGGMVGDFAGLATTSSSSKQKESLTQNVSHILSPTNPNYIHTSGVGVVGVGATTTHDPQMMRQGQQQQHAQPPPPPYPGPPPPYPGRPQMGIRNGCGGGDGSGGGGILPTALRNPIPGLPQPLPPPPPPLGVGIRPALASPSMSPNANPHLQMPPQRRTLLLQEQPLLLEDLLEQEKREQQKQLPPHGPGGLMGAAPEEPLLSDFDFERLKADVLSSSNLPVSLSPPNMNIVGGGQQQQQHPPPGVYIRSASGQLSQIHTSQPPPQPNAPPPPPQWQQQLEPSLAHPPPPPQQQQLPQGNTENPPPPGQPGQPRMHLTPLPPPPYPPEHPTTEQERQQQVQYEHWLFHQKTVLEMQLKSMETEVQKLRKQRKTINNKVKNLKKTGGQLGEQDSLELERITKELSALQKPLEQARKQSRQHTALTTEYRTKQQKKQQQQQQHQQLLQNNQNQMSPLGPSSASSPLHSTPQSPMHMSNSPSMQSGPSPSPLMQHSPMASPLTPSPGPHSATLSQTSPRVVVNPGQHPDDMPFSPSNNDPNNMNMQMRPMMTTQSVRLPSGQQVQMRMASPNVTGVGGHQQIIVQQQSGGPNQVGQQPGIMIVRGINPNMLPMQHQQQLARMRAGPGGLPGQQLTQQRFQRVGNLPPEVLARVKGPQNFPSSMSGMPMSPVGVGGPQQHYVTNARVPFPTQSPNANMNMNMRSPSPMQPVGGLGSPPTNPGQAAVMQMVQNRVSPASSPMRRPSGSSSSIGAPSPMTAERPQSVENPMTPRSGSRPHTPLNSNVVMQQHAQQQQHSMEGMIPTSHAPPPPTSMDSSGQFVMDTNSTYSSCAPPATPTHGEYIVTSAASANPQGGGGGGGPQNHQILPFPTFSWSSDIHKMGLKGGSPFSVINESVNATTANNASATSNATAEVEVAPQATTITVSTSELNNDLPLSSHEDGESSNPPPTTSNSNMTTNTNANTNSTDHSSSSSNTSTVTVPEVIATKSKVVELPPPPPVVVKTSTASAPITKTEPQLVTPKSSTSGPPPPPVVSSQDSILTKNSAVAAVAAVVTSISSSSSSSNKDATPPPTSTGLPTPTSQPPPPSPSVNSIKVVLPPTSSNSHLVTATKSAPPPLPPPPPVPVSVATTSSIAAAAVAAVVSSVTLQAKPPVTSARQQQSQPPPPPLPKPVVSTATVTAVKSVPAPIPAVPVQQQQQPQPVPMSQNQPQPSMSMSMSQVPQIIRAQVPMSLPQQLQQQQQPLPPPPHSQQMQIPVSLPLQQHQQISMAQQPQQQQQPQQIPISMQHSVAPPHMNMTMASSQGQQQQLHPSMSSHQIFAMSSSSQQPQIIASLGSRPQIIGTSSSSGSTVASAVTFVPPTVTAASVPVVVSTLVPTPTSLPPASYTTVLPPNSLVPSSMPMSMQGQQQQQLQPPQQTFVSQQHLGHHGPGVGPGPQHGASTTLIYTSHPNVRMQIAPSVGGGGGVQSLTVPQHIHATIQHHHQQQQQQQQQQQAMIPTSVQQHRAPLLLNDQNSMNAVINQTLSNMSHQSQGESQNALLKQLLQNTGCASMTQTSAENVGFSLTSCLQSRPVLQTGAPPQHTSHLSEAATRIPHPTPVLRANAPLNQMQPVTATGTPLTRPVIKAEQPMQSDMSSGGSNVPELQLPQPQPQPPPPPPPPPPVPTTVYSLPEADIKPALPLPIPQPPPPEVVQVPTPPLDPSKEAILSVVREAAESMLQNQDKSQDSTSSGDASSSSTKKTGEEESSSKKKRRTYQPKRKQSTQSPKESPVSKKRARKVGRTEDDFDGFLENFMTQLRQLSPIGIVEPELCQNFNVCSVPGTGDLSKLTQKNYSAFTGDLTGQFGKGQLASKVDFYNTRPYGPDTPKPLPKPQPTHRGFYYQEFATPKMGTFAERTRSDNRTPTPVRETDTPDTICSASSPECTAWENVTLYPGLKYIDEDPDKSADRCLSPEVPLLMPIPIRPLPPDSKSKQEQFLIKDTVKDMDKENKNGLTKDVNGSKLRAFAPLKEAGNITVTLALSAGAAEDIRGLLRNLANVLSIAAPPFQIIDKGGQGVGGTSTVQDQKSHLYTIKGKDGKERIDIQSILNGAAKFCRHCDVVVLNNVIKKRLSDFPGMQPAQVNGGDNSDEFYFCSAPCFMNFSITHGVTIIEDKAAAIVAHPGDARNINIKTEAGVGRLNAKDCKVKNKLTELDAKSQKTKVKDELGLKADKKWKGSRYRNWGTTFTPPTRYKKPTDKEVTDMLFRLGITAMPSKMPLDTRKCIFCHQPGDGVSDGPGRLLNFDVDKWIHLNCALWSDNVYETENGGLVNVEMALKQSLTLCCVVCKQKGATVKCFKTRCSSVYHLGCATKDGCTFYKNKTIYCPTHIPKGEKENELTTLSVYRRVYIQRDENKQVAAVMHHADQHHLLRVGSLIFLNVGQLLPHQLQAFHTPNFIYPIGYKIARFYWSMRKVNKRCQYICSIHDVDGKPEFRITTQEEGYKEQVVKADTAQAAWLQILDNISRLRNSAEIIRVFPKYITGEDLFGLTEPSIVKVLESLPGIETLTDYHFKYGRNPLLELPLAINPTGCARSEPKLRTHFKKPHTQRTGPSRSTLNTSSVISSEAACPYSKQFVHSKSSQYKKMKQEWRNNVYLARSKIQGLGLYAARDIEKHTMIIEYIGEIIRPELAELREKRYESQNRGIYMFRVDDNRVIDATLCGGLARYINHSCNPNCVAETVEVDRDHRIIIFANRRISRGEEFSYNYHFAVEELQHKIPCLCGAPNCQQWMN